MLQGFVKRIFSVYHKNMKRFRAMCKIILVCLSMMRLASVQAESMGPACAYTNPLPISTYFEHKKPKGKETFTTFFMTIYDVSLWMEKPHWDFTQKSAIRLEYKRDVSKEKIMHYSMGSMGYVVEDARKLAQYEKLLQPFINPVKEGDTFTFVYLPNQGIEFFFNDKSLGVCPDQGFAKAFMNIWLHPKAEYADVREVLLGIKE
jgi:hypothetical protein